jgi:hypothetical protein
MKKMLSLCGLALLLICWGCGTKEEPAPGNQPTTQEKMQKKLTEGAQAAKDYLAQQKEKYGKNMEDKLAEFNKKISELKEKAAAYSGEAKAKLDEQINNLSKESDSVKEKLGKVKDATAETWKNVEDDIDKSFEKLQKDYNDAKDSLK